MTTTKYIIQFKDPSDSNFWDLYSEGFITEKEARDWLDNSICDYLKDKGWESRIIRRTTQEKVLCCTYSSC